MAADAPPAPPKIKILRLAHVYYKHKNIAAAEQFLKDFGFLETERVGKKIFYRGYGSDPFVYCAEEGEEDEFGGTGCVVESMADLELATKTIETASPIYDLKTPGGGKCVTIKDPVDGWPMHLVFGQTPVEPSAEFGYLDFNFPDVKPRKNKFQRFEKGPAIVHKIGHFGMCVTNFAKTYEFYTTKFNFVASDLQHEGDGVNVLAFMHIDLGEEFTDHHSFFIFQGPKSHVHHSSYEVHDFDTEVLGHDWLRHKGYKNCWGVGRHILGSQIFDYWFDTSGFILEHYVDGDQVNCHHETKVSQAGPDGLHVWGPDLPTGFLQ
ncbi:Glyoxalase/Bleomycin resistance protein/Dihydroxybiphenyl dioxygenase [Mytilinidion resinicola]|uniref:Glyoxalase/Bleomycin resistance protein/Dihydroxybiphenyl dioxygenase n=1 Tax=Mytilinidion resinicola TaxID=574789 RepID=A0A6A6Z5H7_9PEZI|nr:Glyoxalase/Bleomycin resistance protein/Dihydroxybiphenyl dioxygenase [Mytilinidion resinicola]KAF2815544.1 Glyoxalase/Bleomycin resistance protein/Dihydroxybiphenyl dioxygenase [Mytilinidion resinicola]